MKSGPPIFKTALSFQKSILAIFILILAGIVFLSIIFYRNGNTFLNTNKWILHTHEVMEVAARTALFSKDVQWESRTYIINGDKGSLNTYRRSMDSLRATITNLQSLTTDNIEQNARVVGLRSVIDTLMNFSSNYVQQKELRNISLQEYVDNKLSQNFFYAEVNRRVDSIISFEGRLLSARQAANNKAVTQNSSIFIAAGTLIFLALALAFILISYNLKKRKHAEQRTAESEAGFRSLVNSIKDLAILTTDPEGRIVNWYAGSSNIKGYREDEVLGKHVSIFYTPEAVENGEPDLNMQTALNNGSCEIQGWRVRKDGSEFWADVLITPMYDASGTLSGFIKVTRDFTMHKRAEDDVKRNLEREKELNEMKSNFVSIASHEFRTPLSTILSSITLLEHYRTTETQDKRDRHTHRIRASVNEMVNILEEFLSLEKIDEGKMKPRFNTFNLKKLNEHVCNKFHTDVKQESNFTCLHSGTEEVHFDEAIAEHVLTNLVSNAVKYSPSNAEIVVHTTVSDDVVTLRVKDNGIGISQADQKHLFERFYRASNTGNVKGTGLGLHIIKRYVDIMRGNIGFNSQPGEGSEFIISFPRSISQG